MKKVVLGFVEYRRHQDANGEAIVCVAGVNENDASYCLHVIFRSGSVIVSYRLIIKEPDKMQHILDCLRPSLINNKMNGHHTLLALDVDADSLNFFGMLNESASV